MRLTVWCLLALCTLPLFPLNGVAMDRTECPSRRSICEPEVYMLWLTQWGGDYLDQGYKICQYGDYLYITGPTRLTSDGSTDVFVLKVSQHGDVLWNKTWGREYDDWGSWICGYNDHIYIAGRVGNSSDFDLLVLKLDLDGNIVWNFTWGEEGSSEAAYYIVPYDDALFVAGYTFGYGRGSDIVLIKLLPNGTMEWLRVWGTEFHDVASGMYIYDDVIYLSGIVSPETYNYVGTYADALIPHYAMAKYPGKPVRYDKGLAERCIKYAERIIKWVEEQASKIPS